MKEPLFHNSFAYEKQTIREIITHFMLKTKIMKAVYIAIPVFALSNVVLMLLSSEFWHFQKILIITFLVSLGFIGLGILETKITNTPKFVDQSISNVLIYDQSIDWKWGKKAKIYNVRKIFAFFETKNYIVLIPSLASSTFIVLKKISFTIGTSEEFIAFLKSNGVRAMK